MSSQSQIQRCDCGRICLTDDQLKSHQAHCSEVNTDEDTSGIVCEDRCTLWRKLLPTYQTAEEMAEDIEYSGNTLRKHIRGECHHDSYEFYWEWTGKYWEARQK